MVFHIIEENARPRGAVIRVIGVGGGGGNALNHMVSKNIAGVDFICTNTDMQALAKSDAGEAIQLGAGVTCGLGAGSDPEVGREAANEAADKLQEAIQGSDMVFITAGLGGGTGTGAAPVIAEIARNMGILTIAVVTKPFSFERSRRMEVAEYGLGELVKHVDSLITIPNDKLLTVLGEDVTLVEGFEKANDVLYGAVQGIAELITCEGLINLDFADVKKVMSGMGMAMIGSGAASGEQRAYEATQSAINNPLLEDMELQDVHGLLVNVTASPSLKMSEYREIGACITDLAAEGAEVLIGTVIDEHMGDELRVTMVATGFGAAEAAETAPASEPMVTASEPAAATPQTPLNVSAAAETAGAQIVTPLPAIKPSLSLAADDGDDDYRDLEQPAVMRQPKPEPADTADDKEHYDDYLDIPAFLRQQVD